MSVILAKNIQANKLEFSAPKTLNNGSRTVYINYQSEKLTLQTPLMSLPYGIGDWNNKDAKAGDTPFKKYDLHVSFRGMENNPAMQTLHDKMRDIETKIKEDCFKNRLTWLRDDYDGLKPAVDRLFTPIIKYDKDKETGKVVGKYPPTMKLKLPFDNNSNAFTFECLDMDGKELNFESIMSKLKGAKARLIIQLGGMWFAGGKYGCTWKVLKARFQINSKSDVDFIEDPDDDGVANETHSDADVDEDAIAMAGSGKRTAPSTYVDEDDDDSPATKQNEEEDGGTAEDDEEADEVEEDDDSEIDDLPPPPPVKKSAGRPKKT